MKSTVWSSCNLACLDPAPLLNAQGFDEVSDGAGERSLPPEKAWWGVRPGIVLKRVGFPRPPVLKNHLRQKHVYSNGRDRDKLLSLALLFLFCLSAVAQNQDKVTNPEPTITFDLLWEAATPQNYTITVDSSGKASYVSRNPTRQVEGSTDPDYTMEFTISSVTRDRIFLLAKAVDYFHGDFDYKHKVADTGRKTLMYADPARHFQTTYNYSENKNIEQITRIFQGISNTIEHGRTLQFKRRFDKLGLEKELKGMEEMASEGYLAEVQIIAPLLQNIVNDTSVLHIARQRAQRLLEGASIH